MEKVVIVGAGLVGSLQAIYMAKKGFEVEVYERRPDIRKTEIVAGRSINLALSDRGWKAIKGAGIEKEIMEMAIPMKGRMMHSLDGKLNFQPYGKEGQAIYSVSRGKLNEKLMDCADSYENLKFFFNQTCIDYNRDTNELRFENEDSKLLHVKADRIFGTDGAFSAIRSILQKTDRFNYEQKFLEHGYKELHIPPASNGQHQLDKNALHIWPRGEFMMIALANLDGSFTCTLFFPFEGKPSFKTLDTEDSVEKFFSETFPDSMELMPNLTNDFFANPTSSLVTIKCSPWNYGGKLLLMGDASHAIVPFYGQGMNAGFEDCSVFDQIFTENGMNWEKSFSEFSKNRKKDADAISDLALQNFIEMRDLVANENFLLRKKIERKFSELYPDKWMPLYSQVTFSNIPYSQALENGRKQERIMNNIMQMPNIQNIWNEKIVVEEILKQIESN